MSSEAIVEPDEERKRRDVRRLTSLFFIACYIGFPLLGVSLVAALVVPFCVTTPLDKAMDTKLTFTSLGCVFGVFQLLLGVLLATIGVSSAFDVDASAGPAKMKLAAASPGILLMLMGNGVFYFALTRQVELTTSTTTIPKATDELPGNESPAKLPPGPQ